MYLVLKVAKQMHSINDLFRAGVPVGDRVFTPL